MWRRKEQGRSSFYGPEKVEEEIFGFKSAYEKSGPGNNDFSHLVPPQTHCKHSFQELHINSKSDWMNTFTRLIRQMLYKVPNTFNTLLYTTLFLSQFAYIHR